MRSPNGSGAWPRVAMVTWWLGRKQALHEQLAKIPRTTDNQYILAHGFSLSDRVYFLLSGKIQQPRKIDALNKKNLAMVFP
ncbi:hypothetical protein LP419_00995 [Massilia sp. H-1]|nr:hypothetical protein LP419_00995 [Massilia sp. H-1]